MTVAVTNASDGPFVGNGTQTAFPFTFDAMTAGEVAVYVDGALVASGFTTTVNAISGGAVTFTTAPAVGKSIVITSAPLFTQDVSLANNGAFLPATIEQALDRGAARDIALKRDLGRALLMPLGQTAPAYADFAAAFRGLPGINGGTASNLTIGLFTGANGQSLAGSPEVVFTSGYSATGKGGACYVKDAAVDAAFVTAHPRWSFRSSQGVGYRLSTEQRVFIEMHGAVGDATLSNTGTDDYAAWLSAKDFIHYYRVWPAGNNYYKPSVPLWFQAAGYRFSHYLDLTDAAYELFGTGNPAVSGHGGTTFWMDAGQAGLVLQSWDTAGISATNQTNDSSQPYNHGASGSHIVGIALLPRGGTVGSQSEHGIILKCVGCLFEHVTARHFGGDGLHLYANVPGAGNANNNRFVFCGFHNNGLNGTYTGGGDSNANGFEQCQANYNRKFGFADGSFLGNWYDKFHLASNGMNHAYGAGPFWASATDVPGTRALQGGHVWIVLPGKDDLAATTQPGTDSTVWQDAGTVDPGWTEAWVSGHKYCSGGARYCGTGTYVQNNNNSSVFEGYTELDQPIGFCQSTACKGFGQEIKAHNGAIVSSRIGSWGTRTDGHTLGREHGGDINTGEVGTVRYDDAIIWSESVDTTNGDHRWSRFGSIVIIRKGDAALAGIDLPRGLSFSGGLTNAANDAAAATAGVQVNRLYRNGSQLMIRVT